jgi:hypothetical protein
MVTASGARWLGVGAVLAAVLAVTGCGHAATAVPPAAASPTADQAGAQRVRAALLTASELPLGFQQQDSADASAMGCDDIDRVYLGPGTTARAAVSFLHAITQSYVNETISLQPGRAAASVTAFGHAPIDCAAFAGGTGVRYRVTALPGVARYGDATAAVRITAAEQEARPVDLVAVRVGDLIVIVANAESGKVDTALTNTVVSRAVTKARRTS